ncbi:hypothetical protein N7491_010994 [Penicillium cf. griseofulvum]|uniref:Uncharacterized protein n=1 Tax=Penicillium cf. griseofulvum TaxID=2972120 RepID=A0A9W9T6D2_9EURO|nr:hypothetical protein N7472_001313 [Penicillium cf. griseofulvum]KAJ5422549.1 hypothetical protein N7491_010994 [Penicillium cf. griseofulvum]KAJ5428726.1 hypothetical protein N7445_010180 [Penicillium cf. griseofulvum]
MARALQWGQVKGPGHRVPLSWGTGARPREDTPGEEDTSMSTPPFSTSALSACLAFRPLSTSTLWKSLCSAKQVKSSTGVLDELISVVKFAFQYNFN